MQANTYSTNREIRVEASALATLREFLTWYASAPEWIAQSLDSCWRDAERMGLFECVPKWVDSDSAHIGGDGWLYIRARPDSSEPGALLRLVPALRASA